MSEWNDKSEKVADVLEQYILETEWEDFPPEVRTRATVCAIDLFGTMIACSRTQMAKNGIELAKKVFPNGEIPVIGSHERFNLMGAVTAYGYNVNALDIDDGHNLIKGHPGAVLMAGILPAALETKASYKELLTALVIGYEVAIRAGLALHQYYGFYHGTGSWGAFGVAAAVCKLYKVDRKVLRNALGIADYQGPLAPVMRIVEIPSMNKDGIAWGAITGVMAVEAAKCGITGEFYNLLEPSNQKFVYTLGKEYEINNLYFKYFPCCRWAHAPIVGVLDLRKKYNFKAEEIDKIEIRTFKAATQLSSKVPKLCDEAQYNMVYPVCAALCEGEYTPEQDSEDYIQSHPEVIQLMEKVEYSADEKFEAEFPRKRYAQVVVSMKSGGYFISEAVEPWGEQEEKIGVEQISAKFKHITKRYISSCTQDMICENLVNVDLCNDDIYKFIDMINQKIFSLSQKEI